MKNKESEALLYSSGCGLCVEAELERGHFDITTSNVIQDMYEPLGSGSDLCQLSEWSHK